MTIDDLRVQMCTAIKGTENAVSYARARELLALLPGWEFGPDNAEIRKQYRFTDFGRALGFAGAVGFIAERENHHPDIEVGWGRCLLRFSTHDVGGLSMNDFISAAKAEAMFG